MRRWYLKTVDLVAFVAVLANTALLAHVNIFLVTFLGKGTDKWLPAAMPLEDPMRLRNHALDTRTAWQLPAVTRTNESPAARCSSRQEERNFLLILLQCCAPVGLNSSRHAGLDRISSSSDCASSLRTPRAFDRLRRFLGIAMAADPCHGRRVCVHIVVAKFIRRNNFHAWVPRVVDGDGRRIDPRTMHTFQECFLEAGGMISQNLARVRA